MWLALVIIIIIILLVYFLRNKGILSNYIFSETYNYILGSGESIYDKCFSDPEKIYQKTVGYNNDSSVNIALQKAYKKDEMYLKNQNSDENIKLAVVNSFIIADLNYFNKQNLDEADKYYKKTLNILNKYPNAITDIHNTKSGLNLNADMIINRVNKFYNNTNYVKPNINKLKIKTIELEKNNNSYYEPKKITNDPQNVHDSIVGLNIENKYKRLLELNQTNVDMSELYNIEELKPVLKLFTGNVYSRLNAKDIEILQLVWNRIHHPDNKNNFNNLKESLIINLKDCIETHYGKQNVVCLVGRCNRVIDSLTLLDSDNILNQSTKTQQILKNEIFSKAAKIVESGDTEENIKLKIKNIQSDYNYNVSEIIEQALMGV